ncbi:cytochrome b5 reductase 4 [Drosophila elegans]|uniref:cytochrome b5 reductase 4 n=1 Tax=Drosophila elegans TaxID=30023 RepID=UPI0007E8AB48|nr:cytochrome b5 reductase 4 [Drosophila elegans]
MSDSSLKPPASNQPMRPPQLVAPGRSTGGLQLPVTAPQKLNASCNGSASSSASGSATGNPRNKCALKPGYSLMSWIRLCNSGADLSGTGGRVVPVSKTELALHNKVDDAWMAIRGRVFNVTRYMDFHPGGVDELMRGVGRDATKLFDEVHAWVNYPQLLGKCYVGPLKENETKPSKDAPQIANAVLKPPEIVPRFDWIQQRSELTLIFYTRSLANPGLLIRRKDSQQLAVRVLVQHIWHSFDFQLTDPVEWPPKVAKIGTETGKIELVLGKMEPAPWPIYGTHVSSKLDSISMQEEAYDCEVTHRKDFNHDSFELSLQSVQHEVLMIPPVGYHVDIEVPLADGAAMQRSYTPVDHSYLQLDKIAPSNSECLNFVIKRYANGPVSSHLHALQVGSRVQLSPPRGTFQLSELTAHRNILLLAAGSGLTPILSLIQPMLKRSTNRIESLQLFYFNKTAEDIWLKEKLEEIHTQDERFSCTNVLSQAEDNPQRISLELLTPLFQKKQPERCTYVAICGPSGFNAAAVDILTQLDIKFNQIHVFRG